VLAGGGEASADEVTAAAYASRLRDARVAIVTARRSAGTTRASALRAAQQLVAATTAVRLQDGRTVAVNDASIADRLARSDLDGALEELEAALATAEAAARGFSGDEADARLRELLRQQQGRGSGVLSLVAALAVVVGAIAERLFGWVPRPDPIVLIPALALIGVALAAALVLLIARGARERLRHETVLASARGERRADPVAHLRRADEAAHGGRAREAIHALYLYALASLAAREVVPDDPALTDRELLARAAAAAHVDELRELLRLHETVWFGLRDADPGETARARSLALRVAG
jgi:hypothetical protein